MNIAATRTLVPGAPVRIVSLARTAPMIGLSDYADLSQADVGLACRLRRLDGDGVADWEILVLEAPDGRVLGVVNEDCEPIGVPTEA